MPSVIEQLFETWQKEIGTICSPKDLQKMGGGLVGFNTQVTRDTVRHFVDAIADLNPIYRDTDYAKKTKYGCLIAPPCFLCSMMVGPVIFRTPVKEAIQGVHGGVTWEWFKPLCEGDELSYRLIAPTDVQLKTSKNVGQMVIYHGREEIFKQGGELIAIHTYWVCHFERKEGMEPDKAENMAKTYEYTEEDIKEIHAAQDREAVRGASPRYWEDVEIGEELTPVVRGPYTLTDAIAWAAGASGVPCDRMFRLRRDPKAGTSKFYDPILKVELSPGMIHFDSNWARKIGVPGAVDFSSFRIALIGMLLNNWIGDEGFLWKLRCDTRSFVVMGDTIWCKGKIANKYFNNRSYCLDIDCWIENQMGTIVTQAKATVILPSREHGAVTYPEPLR